MSHTKLLNLLLSSTQFKKQLLVYHPECLSRTLEEVKNYFGHLGNAQLCENYFLAYVLERDSYALSTFQTFLKATCYRLDIPPILLDHLEETCDDAEKQMILLLSVHYYFVN